jgi:hypothetical protein
MEPTSGSIGGASGLRGLLVGADVVLMLGVAVALLVVAFTVVRRRRPEFVWMVVLAAVLEALSVIALQAIAPALLRHYEAKLETSLTLIYVVPPALSLLADFIQAVVVALLVFVIVKRPQSTTSNT